jgi:hypothetical protein
MSSKYLFTATFQDGSVVKQTQEDRSASAEGKNAFYDVLQRIGEIESFSIEGENIKASVDLNTGRFTLNNIMFQATDPSVISKLEDVTHFRLVYFKRHRHNFGNDNQELSHDIEHHIGWQTTIDGKNYQQTISLD